MRQVSRSLDREMWTFVRRSGHPDLTFFSPHIPLLYLLLTCAFLSRGIYTLFESLAWAERLEKVVQPRSGHISATTKEAGATVYLLNSALNLSHISDDLRAYNIEDS